MTWYNKSLSSIFAPQSQSAVEIGTLSGVRKAMAPDLGELTREDRGQYKLDLSSYRYARSADELLTLLSKIDPDVSTGIWNFLRLANSGLRCIAVDEKMQPSSKLQATLDTILARFSGMRDFKNWDIYMPVEQTANQLLKYLLLRGGLGLELVLNQARSAGKLIVVDPISVKFKQEKAGIFTPYQEANNKEIKLNIPTFFWGLLDPDTNSPYETPPFLPVIQAVLFNISVMQDLERIVKRVAYPRISIKIIENTLRKFAPMEAQTDEALMSNWLRKQKAEIGNALKDMNPEDAAVFFDSIEVSVLETKGNPTVDFRPLKEIIDQRIIAGLKSLPTILGRQFGSSQTLSGVESLLYMKSIASLQEVVAHALSRALSLALRLEGAKGFVKVRYNPVSLRPQNELEAFEVLKQGRVLEQLSLGLITDEQAAEMLTGDPILPPGYKKLSGTGFYKKNASTDASRVNATRNPTAEEGAGGGRER